MALTPNSSSPLDHRQSPELAENLTETSVQVIDQDGSQQGEKQFIIFNPPLVDQQLGIRKSA